MFVEVVHDRFIDGDREVAEAGKEPGENVDRRRLVDGRHMRDLGDRRDLRRHPMGAPRMRMDHVDAVAADKAGDLPGIDHAAGEGLARDGKGPVLLPVMQAVGDPKNGMAGSPGVGQRDAVGLGTGGFEGGQQKEDLHWGQYRKEPGPFYSGLIMRALLDLLIIPF